jgi:hypothetical protein
MRLAVLGKNQRHGEAVRHLQSRIRGFRETSRPLARAVEANVSPGNPAGFASIREANLLHRALISVNGPDALSDEASSSPDTPDSAILGALARDLVTISAGVALAKWSRSIRLR